MLPRCPLAYEKGSVNKDAIKAAYLYGFEAICLDDATKNREKYFFLCYY